MRTPFFKYLEFVKKRYAPRGAKQSFAQSGEDLLINQALAHLKIEKPTYIDIGGHHPVFGSNTYFFYASGGQGAIIEPNEKLCALTRKKRRRDTCICAGAGRIDGTALFYNFPQTTRSTFSEEQAREWEQASGQKAVTVSLPIFSLDTLIARYASAKIPDIVSIDAEGYDFEILSGFSFNARPKVFCIESIKNEIRHLAPERSNQLYDLFKQHDYFPYAETPANTIFIDIIAWTT